MTIDGLAGFAVHAVLLSGFIVWSGRSGGDGGGVLGRPVLGALRTGGTQIASLFQRPVRMAGMFGGSAGISLSYVTAIACSVQAFGGLGRRSRILASCRSRCSIASRVSR